jgi:hypothetical protein
LPANAALDAIGTPQERSGSLGQSEQPTSQQGSQETRLTRKERRAAYRATHRHRAGQKHQRIKSAKIAQAVGIAWPPTDAAGQPLAYPLGPNNKRDYSPKYTPGYASARSEADKQAIQATAVIQGLATMESDLAKIEKMLINGWQIPPMAMEKLPADILLMAYGKIRQGNQIIDVPKMSARTRLMAARVLMMMRGQNINAAKELLPDTPQLHLHQHDAKPVSVDDQRAIALAAIATELSKRNAHEFDGSAIELPAEPASEPDA